MRSASKLRIDELSVESSETAPAAADPASGHARNRDTRQTNCTIGTAS